MVRFRVLGPVEVTSAEGPVPVVGQPLAVLACLLLRANSVVSVDALVDVLWSGAAEAPAHPRGAVQTHVARLRRALGSDLVATVPGGYRLDAGADNLDLLRFRELAEQGAVASAAGDHEAAAGCFAEALALWRGPALQDIDSELLHREEVPALAEQRLDAWQRWAGARIELGDAPVAELQRLTRENPLRERFWEQLILVLYRAGRQADALAAYRQVSAVLADELGLDPGPALQQLHQDVLVGEPTLHAVPQRTVPTPRQLSAVADGFTGRVDELARLAKLLDENVATVVVDGAGGAGKTALALRFAHDVVDRFPDGQVQLNLHGYGPSEPVEPVAALGTLLQSVGVPSEQVPATVEARAALWRTHTAGRAMLVLLDNARNSEQVRPLLPGPGGLVIVTSRSQLGGLVARDGAAQVSVGRLSETDALALLATVVGAERLHPDRAGRRFVEVCARLPLAIRILGQHANQQPDQPLSDLLDEISADPLASFDLDDGADTNLRDIFARSYAALDDGAARLFRLLGLHPGATFGPAAAAALAGQPIAPVRRLLGRLVSANLLEQPRPSRYEFHDLLREFAVEQTNPDDDAAVVRVLDWYVHAALRASHAIRPGWADEVAEPDGLQLPDFAERTDALRWYADELANLLSAIDTAYARRMPWPVCQIALALRPYVGTVPLRDAWVASHDVALTCARELGDRRVEGRILNGLGMVQIRFGDIDAGLSQCEAALGLARENGLLDDEFSALNNIGIAYIEKGWTERAADVGQQAVAVAHGIGTPRLVVLAHDNLASTFLKAKRFDDALDQAKCAEQARSQSGEPMDSGSGAFTRLNVATAEAGLGRFDSSLGNLVDALDHFRASNHVLAQAEALELMGDVHVQLGSIDQARQRYREALDLLVGLGHRDADRVRGKLANSA